MIVISLMFLIIFAAAIGNLYLIESLTTNLTNSLEQLETKVINEEWTEAELIYENLEKEWKKAKNIVAISVDHADLRHLEISINRMSSLIDTKNKTDLLPEITVTKNLVKNIPEEERLYIKNIF